MEARSPGETIVNAQQGMSTLDVERGTVLAPRFDAAGLIAAVPPTPRPARC